MSAAGPWTAALRIARREAWRAKGRSALVIALIGLPVFVLAGADVVYRSSQLTKAEQLTREIGSAQAGVQYSGGPVQQTPSGYLGSYASNSSPTSTTDPSTATLLARLPAGARLIQRRILYSASVQTTAGATAATLTGLDYADPLARGLVDQLSGRAPRTVHEASVTRDLARQAGLHLGDTVTVLQPALTFTVVGIVLDPAARSTRTVYTEPAGLTTAATEDEQAPTTWLVGSATPVSWTQVLALNDSGWIVVSREAFLNPPPAAQIRYHESGRVSVSAVAVGAVTLIGGMSLLEIVLLAGPAFAVGARRQRRELALIAAVGATRRHLRTVVLANGVVLGLAAGLSALVAGVGLGVAALPIVARIEDRVSVNPHIHPLELMALVLISVLTALAAAAFPARAAGRTDVVAALAGRRGQVRTRRWVPVLGLVLASLGALVALAGATTSARWTIILVGVALLEAGFIVLTPAVLGVVARFGRRLPLAPRIALRDAGRNRSAATPAVAAVMASVLGAIAIAIGATSAQDQQRRGYHAVLPPGYAYVGDIGDTEPRTTYAITTAQAKNVLHTSLPGAAVVPVSGIGDPCYPLPTTTCISTQLSPNVPITIADSLLPSVVVDDGTAVSAVLGGPNPAAEKALRAGRVVVFNADQLVNGHVVLGLQSTAISQDGSAASPPKNRTMSVPAALVPIAKPLTALIVPPSLLPQLGLRAAVQGVLAVPAHRVTDREKQIALGALQRLTPYPNLQIETGYHNDSAILLLALVAAAGLLAVGATVIATALTGVDARTDLSTLAAVGAAPRTRRRLSMSRAGVIAVTGTALGVLAGVVPPLAWVHAQHHVPAFAGAPGQTISYADSLPTLHFVVPWAPLLIAVVAIPLIAMATVGICTRARLPSGQPG